MSTKQKHTKRSRGPGRRTTRSQSRTAAAEQKAARSQSDDSLSSTEPDQPKKQTVEIDQLAEQIVEAAKKVEKAQQPAGHQNDPEIVQQVRQEAQADAGEAELKNAGQEPELEPDQEIDEVSPLDAAQNEARANFERFVRAKAELDNVQKRQIRELSERSKYAVEPLARDLLAVMDDLKRALEHASDPDSALVGGIGLVLTNLNAALEKHGVTVIESIGQPFDPNVHEAIAMVPSPDVEAGSVVEEHRSGYRLHDRLLRPALVVVASTETK